MNALLNFERLARLRLIAWLLLGMALGPVRSLAVIQAECRIDGGPSRTMTLTDTLTRPEYTEETFTSEASAAGLTVGPHYLEVRMKGGSDAWTPWRGRWFRVTGETHLVAAEWFLDTDPGAGNGHPIAAPADGVWDDPEESFLIEVDTAELGIGRHTLSIRAQDSNGDWGIVSTRNCYVGRPLTIAAVEWTTDPDQWWEAGQPMNASDGSYDAAEEEAVLHTDSLALSEAYCATPTIYVRARDSWGRLSTRYGMRWNPNTEQWDFDYAAGWGANWVTLVIQPDRASEPSPGPGCLIVSPDGTVTFDWADCQGTSGYDLWVRRGLTEPFARWGTALSESSFTTNFADPSGTYIWMVRSLGGDDCYRDGPIWEATVTMPITGDSDQDGLPDDWEQQVFGPLFVANGATDRDADGHLDWKEAITGTDPLDPQSFFQVAFPRLVPGKFPQFGYPFGVAVDWPSIPDRVYTAYYTTNLQSWGTLWQPLEQVEGTGGLLSTTNFWPEAVGFYRVVVERPQTQ